MPSFKLDKTMPFASESSVLGAGKLEPEYADEFHSWKSNPSPETRGALLHKVQPIIDTAIHTHVGPSASPVVKTQAKLMALNSLNSYDPEKGSMRTHMISQLRGLQRTAAQGNQIISIPERVALNRRHLMDAEGSLRDKLGRDPSDMEIADHTGLSLKRIGYIRQAHSGTNTGSIIDEEGEVHSPASVIPGAHSKDDAWADMIYHDLGDTDRSIMEYTLGLRGVQPISTNEIAARVGLSPGAISQRKAKIQSMLDERYNIDPFGGNDG